MTCSAPSNVSLFLAVRCRVVDGIYADATSWPVVEQALRDARESGAAQLDSPRLLLALTRDRAVRDAIGEGGASPEAVECTAAAWPSHPGPPTESPAIAPETWLVLHRAQSAAFAREHVAVETGHLLLGMLADPAADGARLLAGAGADLAPLAAAIERRLPGQPFDIASQRAQAARQARLSRAEIAALIEDLGEWHKALRSLRERRRAIAAGETPRVADEDVESVRRHAREHAAWIPLRNHHLHLALAAADAHAPAHDVGFTFVIARAAIDRACRKYDGPATEAEFLSALGDAIDAALERAFRQVVECRAGLR